jgi:hypothetical protein
VSCQPELLKMENYREFLRVRREALAARINTFIAEVAGLAQKG